MIGLDGLPWNTMGSNGLRLETMGSDGIRLDPMGSHVGYDGPRWIRWHRRYPMGTDVIRSQMRWKTMESDEIPLDTMDHMLDETVSM